jgi:formiminotetrahydrofolate cyclodeaminase
MSRRSETPFDNIENSYEYVSLLAEAVEEALTEVQTDISLAGAESAQRRREALQLVHFKLSKLSANMRSSRLLLNDLRTLRRLLLDERSLENALRQAAD